MVPSDYIYNQLADTFRKQIIDGDIKPGQKLPSVRSVAKDWSCTIGSVQKAYQLLSEQGLVSSHAGQGTVVIFGKTPNQFIPFRRANLLHKSEAFILEMLRAGYTTGGIEGSIREALDRLSVVEIDTVPSDSSTIRFFGSHDPMVAWVSANFDLIMPGFKFAVNFTGSLRGLIALENNQADVAGCHLWDEITDNYNIPFIQKILPGKKVELVNLATRTIGLIIAPGNPSNLHTVIDLTKEGVRFINRQDGSGIRVWFDAQINKLGIKTANILGYDQEVSTHTEVCLEIAEKRADTGLGLQAAAEQYGLEFIPLIEEQYDLVFLRSSIERPEIRQLIDWLNSDKAKNEISKFPGYRSKYTGQRTTI